MAEPAAAAEEGMAEATPTARPPKGTALHCEPDDSLEEFRGSLAGVPPPEHPKAFLQSVLGSYAHSEDTRSFMFVSNELDLGIPSSGAVSTSVIKVEGLKNSMGQSLRHMFNLSKYSGHGPKSFEEAAEAIKTAWTSQRKDVPFDDTLYVIFLSPSDPDDYIALGGKRLYWLDDDVTTKAHREGLLHAIDFFETSSPAPDGREERRSLHGATLASYFFRVTRQHKLVADGGDIADIWPLPYRVAQRSQLEAHRICLLLNELRELLHPGSSPAVAQAAKLAKQTLHLRTITKATRHHHLAMAEQHRKDVRLLDADGMPHALWKPIDGPPPYGIQYQIGTGTTAYLYMIWYLGWGFLFAFLVSIPILYMNLTGERLTDAGLGEAQVTYALSTSIYNRRPFERTMIYPIFDLIICLVLAASFVAVYRATEGIEKAVDEGQATPEDYSIFISDPPPSLGAGGPNAGSHAVNVYTEFFNALCEKHDGATASTSSTRSEEEEKKDGAGQGAGGAPTPDHSVSEVVIIKNTAYLDLRRKLKEAHTAVHVATAREHWYASSSTQDPGKATKLREGTLAAKAAYKAAEEEISVAMSTESSRTAVSTVFVSFNRASTRDKVLSELQKQTGGWRSIWPLSYIARGPPNFKFTDAKGKAHATYLSAAPASEPNDYMWPNLFSTQSSRLFRVFLGYAISVAFVVGCTAFVIFLQVQLARPPAYQGTFTHLDQLCDDPNFVRKAKPRALERTCGLTSTAAAYLRQEAEEGLATTRDFGLSGQQASWDAYQMDLIRLTPCSSDAATREGSLRYVNSGDKSFPVSDENHEIFKGCEFLTNSVTYTDWKAGGGGGGNGGNDPLWQSGLTTKGGQAASEANRLPGFMTEQGWQVYCNYGLDPNITEGQPLRMISKPYCAKSSTLPGDADLINRTAGPFKMRSVRSKKGLVDAIALEECYDLNCLRCLNLFHQCAEASDAAMGGEVFEGVTVSTVRSLAAAGIVALFSQVIYYAQQALSMTLVAKPTGFTAGERDFMVQILFNLLVFVLFVVFYVNSGMVYNVIRNPVSSLGFAIYALPDIWNFLYSYGIIFMIICFGISPIAVNLSMRVGGRCLMRILPFPTQQLLNDMYEGYPWLPHYVLSYANFVIMVGTALSTTMPLALPVVSVSCFLRYAIDRGHHLLRVYQRPAPVDGTLVKFCVRLMPMGLVIKAGAMYLHYVGTPADRFPLALVLVLTCIFAVLSLVVSIKHYLPVGVEHDSQHQDAANFFTHQQQIRHHIFQSYDPLAKDRSELKDAKRKAKTLDPANKHAPAESLVSVRYSTGEGSVSSAPLALSNAPREVSMGSAVKFSTMLDAIAEVEAEVGPVEAALERATQAAASRTEGGGVGEHKCNWRPYVWHNPVTLPVVAMCPNSGEAVKVDKGDLYTEHKSLHVGTSRWTRSSRLSGASEAHFFDTWGEAKAWMEKNLRSLITNATKAGESAVGTAGSALAPRAHVLPGAKAAGALFTYTGVPVTLVAPTSRTKKWTLTVSRDRGEFPNLQWKVLEASDRDDFQHLLALHGCTDETIEACNLLDGRTAAECRKSREADGAVVWEVQTMAAELCKGTEGVNHVWTRWVAVLRGGGAPRKMANVYTNTAHRVDWGIQGPLLHTQIAGRLDASYHLVALAGTEAKLNSQVFGFMRNGCDWSEQFVYTSPLWPAAWLGGDDAPKDKVLSLLAFQNHTWTLVFTQAPTSHEVARAGGVSAPLEQKVLVTPEYPAQEVASLLSQGYTITTVGYGPGETHEATVTVTVLTKSPSTVGPRAHGTYGSSEALIDSWRSEASPWHRNWCALSGVTISASQTGDGGDADFMGLLGASKAPEWMYRNRAAEVLGPSIMNVLDRDHGAYWSSGTLGSAATPVTVTLDLGEERMVDEISILWGDTAARPMPKAWKLLGAAEGTLQAGPTNADVLKAVEGFDHPDEAACVQAHQLDVSYSRIALTPARKLRVLQLSLEAPQAAGYSIRQILVIGPGA